MVIYYSHFGAKQSKQTCQKAFAIIANAFSALPQRGDVGNGGKFGAVETKWSSLFSDVKPQTRYHSEI